MEDKTKNKQISVQSTNAPSITVDGNGLRLLSTGEIELMLIQVRNEDEKTINALAVGSFRFSREKLTSLRDSLTKTLDELSAKAKK